MCCGALPVCGSSNLELLTVVSTTVALDFNKDSTTPGNIHKLNQNHRKNNLRKHFLQIKLLQFRTVCRVMLQMQIVSIYLKLFG